MSDLIKDLERALRDNKFIEMDSSAFECICDIIESIPSAERKGEWIHDGSVWTYRFNCTNCGYHLLGKQTNFCPSCGARMFAKDTNVPNTKGADDE